MNKQYLITGNLVQITFMFSFLFLNSFAQSNEEWTKIFEDENKSISINKNGITQISDELFFWTFEKLKVPTIIDEINEKVYFIKTYFLVNKELSRYRIIDIIYYDKNNNVIKSFHYNSSYENPIYKYNMPIIAGSDIEKILSKILALIENTNK